MNIEKIKSRQVKNPTLLKILHKPIKTKFDNYSNNIYNDYNKNNNNYVGGTNDDYDDNNLNINTPFFKNITTIDKENEEDIQTLLKKIDGNNHFIIAPRKALETLFTKAQKENLIYNNKVNVNNDKLGVIQELDNVNRIIPLFKLSPNQNEKINLSNFYYWL